MANSRLLLLFHNPFPDSVMRNKLRPGWMLNRRKVEDTLLLSAAFAWPSFQLLNPFKVYLCPAVPVSKAGNSPSPAASLWCSFLGCEHFLLKGFHLIPCKLSGVVQSNLFCKPYAVDWNCFSSSRCVAVGSAVPSLCCAWGCIPILSHCCHRLCHHLNLLLPPSRGSKQQKQADFTHMSQLLKRLNSWTKTKALTHFTPCEGEKRLDLFFLLGVCTQKNAQVAVPDMGQVFRGPGTDHRCLHRQNEGRKKPHRVIVVFYSSSWLLQKSKNISFGGKESPNFLFFLKQSCLRVISN